VDTLFELREHTYLFKQIRGCPMRIPLENSSTVSIQSLDKDYRSFRKAALGGYVAHTARLCVML
jgi:hypothetical protein